MGRGPQRSRLAARLESRALTAPDCSSRAVTLSPVLSLEFFAADPSTHICSSDYLARTHMSTDDARLAAVVAPQAFCLASRL